MTNELEQWAVLFRDEYYEEIQREIKKQIRTLTKKARKKITRGKYDKVNKLLAELDYLQSCHEQAQDVGWIRRFLKTCLEQHFLIEDYPNTTAWANFLQEHEADKEEVLLLAKSLLIKKLTCS